MNDNNIETPDFLLEEDIENPQFVTCFSRDHRRIFAFIFTLLPNRTDAEDVFQKTSLILWQKFDEFEQDRDFCAWACGIAQFTVRNYLRVSGRHRLCFSNDLISSIADERVKRQRRSDERTEALERCMGKLNLEDQDLVRMAYSEDHSIKDIAEQMERAVQTLYNRLNKIRRRLVECIDSTLDLAKENE
ncbi:sigma-70 family RNA polymerase sigma factor [Bremerella sp. P1]|uniref:sigma-70 family RNA polymerase sigma factor n=1 Tax=Bremerella sp. P1 TaxID=3026424 RepID=UPI0023682AD7|nr:sigma-70 family RNA polymerase sigma factor [Bremerella sp. P1]WDI41064.1 sigma-70 family RNA polymerase sigma factor [Bremerella sp. P1]